MNTSTDAGGPTKAYCWSFGRAEFDESRWELRVAGQPVALERKPLEVLHYLLRHAGEVVTKEELLAEVWAGRIVVEAVLTNAVGKLRKALEEDGQEIVSTLSRVGYRLAVPVSRRPVEFVPEDSRLQAGDAVPRRENWKLEAALARTGGNEVWLARHAKTRETRVFKFSLAGNGLHALKREVTIARLLREALGARGDFVQVIDWDFDRAPYFIESEYGGTGLDRWPEGGRASDVPLASRLALFVDAIDAVAAAHGVGVLHKDLKPANLLVYEVGGVQRLRVADFGSSRLFDSGWLDQLGITHLGMTQTQAITNDTDGTPLYLAPELAAGQASTVKSDIYALGVTLYQLVVGDFRRPLAAGWENDIADPLLRQDIADAANGDPAKRPDSAALLAERIRNLEARREQRALEYAVRARIADGEKRLAKVRARRPWMIAAMLALILGVTASLFYALRAHEAQLQAQTEAARANDSLKAQTLLNEFLTEDVIGAAAPDKNKGEQPTVLQALDKAELGIDKRFANDPGSAGTMRLALAHAYQATAQIEKSRIQFATASPLLEKAFGTGNERSYDALLGQAHMLIELGKLDEGAKLLALAGNRLANQAGASSKARYHYVHTQAYLHERRSDQKSAAVAYRDLVDLTTRHPELGQELLLKSRAELGYALLAIGQADEALRELQESLDGQERLNGRLDSRTLQARQNIVQALMQANRLPEAIRHIDILETDLLKVLGNKHPQLANVNTLRAIALVAQEHFAEAAEEYGKASKLFSETLSVDSPFVLSTLQYRGEALRWAGKPSDAVESLVARLPDAKQIFGDPSPAFAEYAMILAMAYLDLDEAGKATALLPYIHSADGKISEDVNSQRVPYLRLLEGRFAEARGDDESALKKYQEALAALPEGSDYSKEVAGRIAEMVKKPRGSALKPK